MAKKKSTKAASSVRVATWYDARLDLHTRFAAKMRGLVIELLQAAKIQVDRVDCRVKTRESFLEKANRDENGRRKYRSPTRGIKDIVGVRVVTYLDSSVAKVCEVIENEFEIDAENSVDKDLGLGADRVGYRSRHYVAQLGKARAQLVEFAEFKGVLVELQVRSMLQHAWAEIEHDRRFKFPGELPVEVRRRYSLIAGQLEIADRELDSLAEEIDRRTAELTKTAANSSASKKLTVDRLSTYLRGVFSDEIDIGMLQPSFGGVSPSDTVKELALFGVSTVGAIAKLVPRGNRRVKALAKTANTFLGVLRRVMLVTDPDRYFEKAWRHRWEAISPLTIQAVADAGVDLVSYAKKHHLAVHD